MATLNHTLGLTKEATDGLLVEIDSMLREITTLWWIFQNRQNSITYIFSHLRLNVAFIIFFSSFQYIFHRMSRNHEYASWNWKASATIPCQRPVNFWALWKCEDACKINAQVIHFIAAHMSVLFQKDVLKIERSIWQ